VNAAVGPPDLVAEASAAIRAYYAFTGQDRWGSPVSSPAELTETIEVYRALGADEVLLYCYGSDPGQSRPDHGDRRRSRANCRMKPLGHGAVPRLGRRRRG
jgi:hypothetical protein